MKESARKMYEKGLGEGLFLALRLADGVEDAEAIRQKLEDELKFRKLTGIDSRYSHEELDRVGEALKQIVCQTMRIALVASIADTYGFGPTRVRRCIDAFDKLTDYLDHGWLCWLDLIGEIKARFGWDLSIESGPEVLRHYDRPLAEDMYEEADFIPRDEWKAALQAAKFREAKDAKGRNCVYDGDVAVLSYENRYEQLQAYDLICGMLYEREKKERPKKPTVVAKPKKRRRRH